MLHASYCTCQNIKLKDGPFSSDEEEHWTIRMPPVRLVHKEPLEKRQAGRDHTLSKSSAQLLFLSRMSGLHHVIICSVHSHWIAPYCKHRLIFLYLREGANVLSVEVVQLLVNPALLHMLEGLMTTGCERQESLLGFLQLEITHTLLDLPQNPSWH